MRNLRGRVRRTTKKDTAAARRYARKGRVHDDATMVDVDAYKRNPPTPPWPAWLTERLVRVRHHWRRPPYIAVRTYTRPITRQPAAVRRRAAAMARARGWL